MTDMSAEEKAATDRGFTLGYILAVSTIFHKTGDDVSCHEAMSAAGIEWDDLQGLDLCELDTENMLRIFWHRGGLHETLGNGEMSASEYLAAQVKS